MPAKASKKYDYDDESYDIKDSIATSEKSVPGSLSEGCDFDTFSTFMSKKYGKERFEKGYEVILKNKKDRFSKNSDMDTLLKGILAQESDVEEFVNICSSFLILENYAKSMSGE